MTSSKEQSNPQPNAAYEQAQEIINQSIASMDGTTHIEYHSTIGRNVPRSRLKRLKQRLLHLLS